jgi:ribosomal protein L37AE/L43A
MEKFTRAKKLKSKRKVNKQNYRLTNRTCPECGSNLELDEVGIWECTRDKLKIWEEEFIKYDKMNDKNKKRYLLLISDVSRFGELYNQWSKTDSDGNRPYFDCGYSNKLFNPICRSRTTLPDPILVATIEKNLGRNLTHEEKTNEVEIFKQGKSYFSDYKKGRAKVKIPQIVFPDGFLTKIST